MKKTKLFLSLLVLISSASAMADFLVGNVNSPEGGAVEVTNVAFSPNLNDLVFKNTGTDYATIISPLVFSKQSGWISSSVSKLGGGPASISLKAGESVTLHFSSGNSVAAQKVAMLVRGKNVSIEIKGIVDSAITPSDIDYESGVPYVLSLIGVCMKEFSQASANSDYVGAVTRKALNIIPGGYNTVTHVIQFQKGGKPFQTLTIDQMSHQSDPNTFRCTLQ